MIVIFLTFFTLGSLDFLIFSFWPQTIFFFLHFGPSYFFLFWIKLNFSNSAMNVMKNNSNSNYDQINSKLNKKIGKSKAYARLTKKTHKKHLIKQESNENHFSFFLEKLKIKKDKLHLIDGYFQTALWNQALITMWCNPSHGRLVQIIPDANSRTTIVDLPRTQGQKT